MVGDAHLQVDNDKALVHAVKCVGLLLELLRGDIRDAIAVESRH